jgi:dynein heavy chain
MSLRVAEENAERLTIVTLAVPEAKTHGSEHHDCSEKQVPLVAARGAMLFFPLNSLNKIHHQFSLNALCTSRFARGIDVEALAAAGQQSPCLRAYQRTE